MHSESEKTSVSIVLALLPVVVLISLLGLSVYFFADDSSYGGNQIALLIATAMAAFIGLKLGHTWDDLEQAMIKGISHSMIAILILLVVGALIGSWMLAGTVQTMIYYGLQLISADWFYAAACLVCGISALSIGSSWTVAGTLGIAFMGMSQAMQLNPAITAGAVVSGAYFGDKLSPLSDTTNLAAAVTGTELFRHIENLLWTTIPAFLIALIAFILLGDDRELANQASIDETIKGLSDHFDLGIHLLIPVAVVFILAWRRAPALPTISAGAILGCIFAGIYQGEAIAAFITAPDLSSIERTIQATWISLFNGYTSNTGNEALDSLLTRGGMSSMLNTVWLILCAMAFGSVMEHIGLLQRILQGILSRVRSVTGLIISTVFTCIGSNVLTADQYIGIVLPGRMFKLEYARYGLASENLSRTLEDSATLTSPLIPWNTCGAYMAATLGVATFSYLPYAIFNLMGPVLCIGFAVTHFRLVPLDNQESLRANTDKEIK